MTGILTYKEIDETAKKIAKEKAILLMGLEIDPEKNLEFEYSKETIGSWEEPITEEAYYTLRDWLTYRHAEDSDIKRVMQLVKEALQTRYERIELINSIRETEIQKAKEICKQIMFELYEEYDRHVNRKEGTTPIIEIFNEEYHKRGFNILTKDKRKLIIKPTEITIKKYNEENELKQLPENKRLTIKGYIGIEIDGDYQIERFVLLDKNYESLPTFHTDQTGRICLGNLEIDLNKIRERIKEGKWKEIELILKEIEVLLSIVDREAIYGNFSDLVPEEYQDKYIELYKYISGEE